MSNFTKMYLKLTIATQQFYIFIIFIYHLLSLKQFV